MTNRPRVLHYYARYLEHPSGVTDSLNHWAQASVDAGDEVAILAAQPRGGDRNEFAAAEITRTIPHWGRGRGSWIPVGLLRELRAGDLLVLHEGWVISNAFASLAARIKKARTVVVPHGVYEAEVVKGQRDLFGIRRRLERATLKRADAIHVFYEGERAVVNAFEPSATPFIVAPNGASAVDEASRWNGAGDYFLWMGRFDPFHKGIDNLVEFWSRLAEPRPKLMLVGPDFLDGRDAIRKQIADLGLGDSVEIRGRVTGDEKDALLANARAYLHPSRWESCSIMLLEATAAGVPCLISSTIHAAHELEPIGVLESLAFDDVSVDADAGLGSVDRNAALGARARQWADTRGSWSEVGPELVAAQTQLGLRKTGVRNA